MTKILNATDDPEFPDVTFDLSGPSRSFDVEELRERGIGPETIERTFNSVAMFVAVVVVSQSILWKLR